MISFGRLRAEGGASGSPAQPAPSRRAGAAAGPQPQERELSFMPRRDETTPPARPPSGVGVGGYVSPPSLTRASRAQIDLFVNRRYVEDRSLTHAVVQAYHTLLPVGRYPLAVLFVDLDPAEVDVNVHPRKTEVRFADSGKLYSALQRAVRRAVIDNASVPELPLAGQGERPADEEGEPRSVHLDQSGWAARRQSILNAGMGRQPAIALRYARRQSARNGAALRLSAPHCLTTQAPPAPPANEPDDAAARPRADPAPPARSRAGRRHVCRRRGAGKGSI